MAGNGQVVSVNSNPVPVGGTTAQQPVTPSGSLTPATIAAIVDQLTPATAKFRSQSTPLTVDMPQVTWSGQGNSYPVDLPNVGLCYRLRGEHVISTTLTNMSGSAQVVHIGSRFPYSLIQQSQVQVNGGANPYSASGYGGLLVAARRKRSLLLPSTRGGFGPALHPALARVSFDAEATPTNASATLQPLQLSGVVSISIAGTESTVITTTFYTNEWLALDIESGVGVLPMQNNATHVTLRRTLNSQFLGTTNLFPFYVPTAVPSTLTVSAVSGYSNTAYDYFSVPASAALYQQMVANSYQVQEDFNNSAANYGFQSLQYNIPQNTYLVAASLNMIDNAGVDVPQADVSTMQVVYNNGAIIPVTQFYGRERAKDFFDYGIDTNDLPGYLLWDGQDTANDLSQTDNMGWIDTYNAAKPQIVATLSSGPTYPITYSVIRESLVLGATQVVGG